MSKTFPAHPKGNRCVDRTSIHVVSGQGVAFETYRYRADESFHVRSCDRALESLMGKVRLDMIMSLAGFINDRNGSVRYRHRSYVSRHAPAAATNR